MGVSKRKRPRRRKTQTIGRFQNTVLNIGQTGSTCGNCSSVFLPGGGLLLALVRRRRKDRGRREGSTRRVFTSLFAFAPRLRRVGSSSAVLSRLTQFCVTLGARRAACLTLPPSNFSSSLPHTRTPVPDRFFPPCSLLCDAFPASPSSLATKIHHPLDPAMTRPPHIPATLHLSPQSLSEHLTRPFPDKLCLRSRPCLPGLPWIRRDSASVSTGVLGSAFPCPTPPSWAWLWRIGASGRVQSRAIRRDEMARLRNVRKVRTGRERGGCEIGLGE